MQTPHILIVEDELVTRNTLKSIFEAEGYDVFEATDGAEMHQILSENDINLVIMDINLPGKNGLLLARELREQADVALMFLTGRDNEVDKILGLEIGADFLSIMLLSIVALKFGEPSSIFHPCPRG